MLILIPDGTDYDAAVTQVEQIMCSSMQEFTPGIPIETECLLADCWYKDVEEQPKDRQGRIVPYTRQLALAEQNAMERFRPSTAQD